jgi:hypothetical protein
MFKIPIDAMSAKSTPFASQAEMEILSMPISAKIQWQESSGQLGGCSMH